MLCRWPGNVRELRNTVERTVARFSSRSPASNSPPRLAGGRSGPSIRLATPPSAPDVLYERMTESTESFWDVVHCPFMTRDITRKQLRDLIARGLEETFGSYKVLADSSGSNLVNTSDSLAREFSGRTDGSPRQQMRGSFTC